MDVVKLLKKIWEENTDEKVKNIVSLFHDNKELNKMLTGFSIGFAKRELEEAGFSPLKINTIIDKEPGDYTIKHLAEKINKNPHVLMFFPECVSKDKGLIRIILYAWVTEEAQMALKLLDNNDRKLELLLKEV